MRRTRLIWMAAGVAIGLIASTLPDAFVPSPESRGVYLWLDGSGYDLNPKSERYKVAENLTFEDWQSQQDRLTWANSVRVSVVEEVWLCGSRNFSVIFPSHGLIAGVPVLPRNTRIIDCLIDKSRDKNIPITIADSEYY